MMQRSNVVPPVPSVSEVEFHNAMVTGLARAQAAVKSQTALAAVMGLKSAKQVGNILAGAGTDPKRLWDARNAEPTVLDDIAALYGCRIVAKEAICHLDGKLSVAGVALLKKVIDAEIDGIEDHRELLGMEAELRDVRALIDARLERIAEIRRPRVA